MRLQADFINGVYRVSSFDDPLARVLSDQEFYEDLPNMGESDVICCSIEDEKIRLLIEQEYGINDIN